MEEAHLLLRKGVEGRVGNNYVNRGGVQEPLLQAVEGTQLTREEGTTLIVSLGGAMSILRGAPLGYVAGTSLRVAMGNLQGGLLGSALITQLGEALGALMGGIAGTLQSWSPRERTH